MLQVPVVLTIHIGMNSYKKKLLIVVIRNVDYTLGKAQRSSMTKQAAAAAGWWWWWWCSSVSSSS
jgi:hypothetical protein